MASDHLKIGFVRRGYSSSGGAEAYLKRLAAGVCAAGHEAQLFTTSEWPKSEWPFGAITHLPRANRRCVSPTSWSRRVRRSAAMC